MVWSELLKRRKCHTEEEDDGVDSIITQIRKTLPASAPLYDPDEVEDVFDHPNLVSESNLLLMATLARRVGIPALVR